MRLASVVVCGWFLMGFSALAETPPAILDVGKLPTASAAARASYRDQFLVANLPRVFALASGGAYGSGWGTKTIEESRSRALANCASKGGTDCKVYAEDLAVVWPGLANAPVPAPSAPLIEGTGFAFVPDSKYLWHDPKTARGLVVWSHGKGDKDERGQQTPAYVRWFNNAGFDVVRFDREMAWDQPDRAAQWLRDGLAQLRSRGWRTIIAAGQSRGAWNSLQILDTAGLADVVIAVSPAAQGTDAGNVATKQGPALWTITHAANAPKTRVAFVQFAHDPYSGDQDDRVAKVREYMFPHVAAGLIIDRPDGFSGHHGGDGSEFSQKYGACLLWFALDPTPPGGC